jgi:hypothetical protein
MPRSMADPISKNSSCYRLPDQRGMQQFSDERRVRVASVKDISVGSRAGVEHGTPR